MPAAKLNISANIQLHSLIETRKWSTQHVKRTIHNFDVDDETKRNEMKREGEKNESFVVEFLRWISVVAFRWYCVVFFLLPDFFVFAFSLHQCHFVCVCARCATIVLDDDCKYVLPIHTYRSFIDPNKCNNIGRTLTQSLTTSRTVHIFNVRLIRRAHASRLPQTTLSTVSGERAKFKWWHAASR